MLKSVLTPKNIVFAILVIAITGVAAYLIYSPPNLSLNLFPPKAKIISAQEFKEKEASTLADLASVNTTKELEELNITILILDLRSREEYKKEHLKGATYLEKKFVESEQFKPKLTKLYIYSKKVDFAQTRKTADSLASKIPNAEIFVIEGGYESIKGGGFTAVKNTLSSIGEAFYK